MELHKTIHYTVQENMSLFVLLFICLLLSQQSIEGFRFLHCKAPKQHFKTYMIFDFFKQRTKEGIAQVQNLATKTLEGKLQEALQESAEYIQTRQRIDAENFKKIITGLSKSRDQILNGITNAFAKENQETEDILSQLEMTLLSADLGSKTTNIIMNDLRSYSRTERLGKDDIKPILRERLLQALNDSSLSTSLNFDKVGSSTPFVIFVIGANGMGKTTTIGKLAARLRNEVNLTVLVGACDTFRAAAVEQLQEWTSRANVSIELPTELERNGSPVPVVRRTLQRAVEEKFDTVIIDTAGRLSNNFELTIQLQDMKKAIQSIIPQAPHETLLVVDASVGRNAVEQAKSWNKNVGVSGIIVTKMDGTARAGFVISTVQELKIPIKFIGVGEKLDDLRDFDAEVFVDALLGNDPSELKLMKQRAEKILQTAETNSKALKNLEEEYSKELLTLTEQSMSTKKNDDPRRKIGNKNRRR